MHTPHITKSSHTHTHTHTLQYPHIPPTHTQNHTLGLDTDGRGLFKLLMCLREAAKKFDQDNRCVGQVSKHLSAEYKLAALQKHQPVRSVRDTLGII